MIVIAVDAMGGDKAPAVAVEGAVLAAQDRASSVVLVGDETKIRAELARLGAPPSLPVQVHHASQVIEMHEHPALAVRRKRDASMRVCFDLVAAGRASAVVSAGNSGGVMASALRTHGRIKGVERPAIATLIPTRAGGYVVLIDSGANTDCKPLHLAQFGLMGAQYARNMLRVHAPRIAILSNGEEVTKGTWLTREAAELLRRFAPQNYVGYVEGRDIFKPLADVVVCDGFTGNVVLKTVEGLVVAAMDMLKEEIYARREAVLGAALMKRALSAFKKRVNYEEVGGAPLLGTRATAIIAHGGSSAKAIKNAIHVAERAALSDVTGLIDRSIAEVHARHGDVAAAAAARGANGAGAGAGEGEGEGEHGREAGAAGTNGAGTAGEGAEATHRRGRGLRPAQGTGA
jgi:glycerol-3-phosphate acyltransferase PlsX